MRQGGIQNVRGIEVIDVSDSDSDIEVIEVSDFDSDIEVVSSHYIENSAMQVATELHQRDNPVTDVSDIEDGDSDKMGVAIESPSSVSDSESKIRQKRSASGSKRDSSRKKPKTTNHLYFEDFLASFEINFPEGSTYEPFRMTQRKKDPFSDEILDVIRFGRQKSSPIWHIYNKVLTGQLSPEVYRVTAGLYQSADIRVCLSFYEVPYMEIDCLPNIEPKLKLDALHMLEKVLAMRLFIDMQRAGISRFSLPDITPQQDFINLCNERVEPNHLMKQLSQSPGTVIANYFTDVHRLKAQKVITRNGSPKLSVWDLFQRPQLIGCLTDELRKHYTGRMKKSNRSNPALFDNGTLYKALVYNTVTAFPPILVKSVIAYLNNKGITGLRRICDWCAGWGGRLVGAVAAKDDYHIERYVGTDPNIHLQGPYQEILECVREARGYPEGSIRIARNENSVEATFPGFDAIIYNSPVEDLTQNQLCPDGTPSDIMLTSPPFGDYELYLKDEKQSEQRYPNALLWINGFLMAFIEQSIRSLRPGGILAVQLADMKSLVSSSDSKFWRSLDSDTEMRSFRDAEEGGLIGIFLFVVKRNFSDRLVFKYENTKSTSSNKIKKTESAWLFFQVMPLLRLFADPADQNIASMDESSSVDVIRRNSDHQLVPAPVVEISDQQLAHAPMVEAPLPFILPNLGFFQNPVLFCISSSPYISQNPVFFQLPMIPNNGSSSEPFSEMSFDRNQTGRNQTY